MRLHQSAHGKIAPPDQPQQFQRRHRAIWVGPHAQSAKRHRRQRREHARLAQIRHIRGRKRARLVQPPGPRRYGRHQRRHAAQQRRPRVLG
jgi:hypothetical protein